VIASRPGSLGDHLLLRLYQPSPNLVFQHQARVHLADPLADLFQIADRGLFRVATAGKNGKRRGHLLDSARTPSNDSAISTPAVMVTS
jgi:hypothetical protein